MYSANPFSNQNPPKGKKFIASFSGGKDSMLSIYRCIKQGMIPYAIMTTCPEDATRSWFHKIPLDTLKQVSDAINIPLILVKTQGDNYGEKFEETLKAAFDDGVEYAVFGDIDIDEHLKWCSDRCKNVGITPFFPLWKENREKLVREFIDSGFKATIVVTPHEKLKNGFLGEILTHELLDKIAQTGVDICGENGEYHTLVTDGPIFSSAVCLPCEERL